MYTSAVESQVIPHNWNANVLMPVCQGNAMSIVSATPVCGVFLVVFTGSRRFPEMFTGSRRFPVMFTGSRRLRVESGK
jgi:hypothetical protein